jgi:predicted RNase H-like nuclease (RuvC/YqgF family)
MASVTLIHPEQTVTVPVVQAINKCSLFQNNPALLVAPYQVASSVNLSIFREFVSELEGKTVKITGASFTGLQRLCKGFRPSMSFKKTEDPEARARIAALEEKAEQHDHVIVILQDELTQHSTSFERLVEEISTLRSATTAMQTLSGKFLTLKRQVAQKMKDSVVEQLSTDFNELQREVFTLKDQITAMPLTITDLEDRFTQLGTDFGRLHGEVSAQRSAARVVRALSEEVYALETQIAEKLSDPVVQHLSTEVTELRDEVSTLKRQIAAIPITATSPQSQPPPPSVVAVPPPQQQLPVRRVPLLDSRIISDFPEIFADFQEKHFKILWRGSRDGFKAQEFHRRCDGHANTLTVILDTNGNIFGGFTPVKWESRAHNGKFGDENNTFQEDVNMKSFLFTLKNPHHIPPRRFALKAGMKHRAIVCNSLWGPLGYVYTNDTDLDKYIVLTGAKYFKAKEIEVFEIHD